MSTWWTLVATAISGLLTGLSTAWWVAKRFHPSKRLDWTLIADERIPTAKLASAPATAGKLQVLWSRLELRDPRLITLRIRNTGRAPISHKDFGNRTIRATAVNALFLSVTVLKASSPELEDEARLCWQNRELDRLQGAELPPVLFNEGEWLEVQFLLDGGGPLSFSGRFTGQTREMRHVPADRQRVIRTVGAAVVLIPTAVIATVGYRFYQNYELNHGDVAFSITVKSKVNRRGELFKRAVVAEQGTVLDFVLTTENVGTALAKDVDFGVNLAPYLQPVCGSVYYVDSNTTTSGTQVSWAPDSKGCSGGALFTSGIELDNIAPHGVEMIYWQIRLPARLPPGTHPLSSYGWVKAARSHVFYNGVLDTVTVG